MLNTTPSLWFTKTKPTAIYLNSLYIWEEDGYLQLGVAVAYPVSVSGTNKALVLLNSEENGTPDAELYTSVIRKVVSAWQTSTLTLEGTTSLNELLPAIPVPTSQVSTAKEPATHVRFNYTVDLDDTVIMAIQITDVNGFVMAYNSAKILTGALTTPTPLTNTLDVLYLPPSTTPTWQQGDFSTADTTLLPNKFVGFSLNGKFKPVPCYWYGNITATVPPQFDTKQVAVWRNSAGALQFGVVLPFDELLTKPSRVMVKGTIVDVTAAENCASDKWWYVASINSGLPANQDEIFLNKLITAANNGVLFLSDRQPYARGSNPLVAYSTVPNSISINFGIQYGDVFTPASGNYYSQELYMTVVDNTKTILATITATVRMTCYGTAGSTTTLPLTPAQQLMEIRWPGTQVPTVVTTEGTSGGNAMFPGTSVYFGSQCEKVRCGNATALARLAMNGANQGINILQGRGGIPTGTDLTTGMRASFWELTRAITPSLSLMNLSPMRYSIAPDKTVYMPYLGKEAIIHSNHNARAGILGYTHYYYPDNFHPLDIGVCATFGAVVTGSNYTTWVSTKTSVVADDDKFYAVKEAAKGNCVYLSAPNYTDADPTRQLSTKSMDLFLPNRDVKFATLPLVSSTTLSLDLSDVRSPTPLFSMDYAKPRVEYNCILRYESDTIQYTTVSNASAAANLFIGFSRQSAVDGYMINHTLKLPDPFTTVSVLTGLTNYPEYAVPFTINSPLSIAQGDSTPLAPKFVGRLPTNYKMLWVDWTSITSTTITVYYWIGPTGYADTTNYTTSLPPGSQAIALVLPLIVSTVTATTFNGTVPLSIEVEADGQFSKLRIFAGDSIIAQDTSKTLPWINGGSILFHARGGTALNTVKFGAISAVPGKHSSPIDDAASNGYIELQMETVTSAITASTAAQMDLKPYTLYWDSSNRDLYIPVLRSLETIPTQFAKSTFFNSGSGTPAEIADLLANMLPSDKILLSNGHGTLGIPTGPRIQLFSSLPIMAEDNTVVYYWRKGTTYAATIGPLIATLVPGVTIPTSVPTLTNGTTTNLINAVSELTDPTMINNVSSIGTNLILTGITGVSVYVKLPLRLEVPNASKYTVQFTRVQTGTWQSTQTTSSHFAVYFFPNRPDYTGIPVNELVEKPQIRAVRFLFPKAEGPVLVQTSQYRGYGWDVVNEVTQVYDLKESAQLSGEGQMSGYNGEAIIAITCVNKDGNFGFTLYENKIAKYTGVLPIPYINNGTLAFALKNTSPESSETLGMVELVLGDMKQPTIERSSTVFCVPTTTYTSENVLTEGVSTVCTSISAQAKYGYLTYTVTNLGLATATIDLYITLSSPSESTRIARIVLPPNKSRTVARLYVHRNETLIAMSDTDNVRIGTYTIVQL